MDECKHGNNKWSCLKCEVELMKNVVSELEQKLSESESRVQRLSVKYRFEREERVPKLEEKVDRYEKALKEIADDEKDCEFQSELGYMDYYNGYEKTEIAIKALKNN